MKKLALYIFVLLIGAWGIGLIYFHQLISSYDYDTATKTDAIIALTGGRNRISKAVALLDSGMAEKLFISGVSEKTSLSMIEKRNEIVISKKQQVQVGKQARDTIGNAIEADEWIKKNNINSIRLVTSNYHLPRSMLEFQHQNPQIAIVPHPVYSENVSQSWWKNWGSFRLIAMEYNKFLYVYLTKNILTSED